MKGKTTLIIAGLLLIFGVWGCSGYNGLINKEEEVKNAWGKVQSAYQRRADLIPGLVEAVKGVSNFEKSTLTAVVEARASATSIKISADQLTEENIQKFQNAYGQMNSALGRLLAVAENYPTLTATEAYKDFMREYAGTENRINTERNGFNEAVTAYNKSVRRFPNNLISGIFGFSTKAQFQADAGSEKRPEIKF